MKRPLHKRLFYKNIAIFVILIIGVIFGIHYLKNSSFSLTNKTGPPSINSPLMVGDIYQIVSVVRVVFASGDNCELHLGGYIHITQISSEKVRCTIKHRPDGKGKHEFLCPDGSSFSVLKKDLQKFSKKL